MFETFLDLLGRWLGSLGTIRRRRRAMLAELRCIYANQAWPRVEAEIDKVVGIELKAVDETGLERRFELVQIALRRFMRIAGPLADHEIALESGRRYLEALLMAVKAHGREPGPEELLDVLRRLHTPSWLDGREKRPLRFRKVRRIWQAIREPA